MSASRLARLPEHRGNRQHQAAVGGCCLPRSPSRRPRPAAWRLSLSRGIPGQDVGSRKGGPGHRWEPPPAAPGVWGPEAARWPGSAIGRAARSLPEALTSMCQETLVWSKCVTGSVSAAALTSAAFLTSPEGRSGCTGGDLGPSPSADGSAWARAGLELAGTLPWRRRAASLGHLGLQGAGQVEVPPDGVVVGAGTECHKEVPDGVGEGHPAVALEEHGAQAVESPSGHQLPQALGVGLSARMGFKGGGGSEERPARWGAPGHSPHTPKMKRPGEPPRVLGGASQHRDGAPSPESVLTCHAFLLKSPGTSWSLLPFLPSYPWLRPTAVRAGASQLPPPGSPSTIPPPTAEQPSSVWLLAEQNGICALAG